MKTMINNQFSKYVVKPNITVIDAMKAINRNTEGIVYVCNDDGILFGTLTDGDIRRYIIHNGDLHTSVEGIVNKTPVCISMTERKKGNTIMEEHSIRSVPVVDKENRIIEILFLNKRRKKKINRIDTPVIIMAGGMGTRLKPYTNILPKPLIPVGDKTITEHIIDRFKRYGCSAFTIIVNYKKHFIESYFKEIDLDVNISFVEEQEFRGTGGGLSLLKGMFSDTVFLSNCDILVEGDYTDILKHHKDQKNIVTMVCAIKNSRLPYGTVEMSEEGKALRLKEKPEFSFVTNTGLYVLEPEFISRIPDDGFCNITDAIQECIDDGLNVGVYPVSEEAWMDMGQLDELKKMTERLEELK